ncbi:YidC/Oxa1 family membrane protein insertase, partial [Streptomyces ureilyticus]
MSVFAGLVEGLADLLEPLFQASAAAAAIVLFTAFVRLLVHPLSRAAARGQRERAKLQPQIAALRKKHGKNPEKLQKAVMELHAKEKVSPLSGCLPSLFQAPAFFLLYHLFSNSTIGGEANALLAHKLFAAPLGGRWAPFRSRSRTTPPRTASSRSAPSTTSPRAPRAARCRACLLY